MATLTLNDYNQNRYNLKLTKGLAKLLLSVGIAVVVEHYSDGATWYRLYSDGWCEQGGLTPCGNNKTTTINLLKSYKDTTFNCFASFSKGSNLGDWGDTLGAGVSTVNSIVIFRGHHGSQTGTLGIHWLTMGQTDYAL